MHSEGSWRYDNLQWRFAARGKLKFSSAIGFAMNIKTMSADIWQQRLCSWVLFFPLSCYFIAFISLPALPGRGNNLLRSAAGVPHSPSWKRQPPSPRCFSVLTPDVSSWCLQINIQASSKTEHCSSGRFMDASGCFFIFYCMVQSLYV